MLRGRDGLGECWNRDGEEGNRMGEAGAGIQMLGIRDRDRGSQGGRGHKP